MNSDWLKPVELPCKFCGKFCKNRNSLVQHELRCKNNPERLNVITPGFNSDRIYKTGKAPWNKGLTKELDLRLEQQAVSLSKSTKGKPGIKHTEATKAKLSNIAKARGLGGFNMRNKGFMYNGVKLDSSYEVAVAESLDYNSVKWRRCARFQYTTPNGEQHYYTPDFYLPEYDIYLDPKNNFLINNTNPALGYKDSEKITWVMRQNNIRILILDSSQLDWESIKNLI
jgi:hypothetical protein